MCRRLSRNFRDQSAHSFAPRQLIGETSRVLRSIVPWTDLVERPDGTFADVVDPARKMVQGICPAWLV